MLKQKVISLLLKSVATPLFLGLATFHLAHANLLEPEYQQATNPSIPWASSTEADNFFDATHLLDMRQGSILSDKVSDFRSMGYETATGKRVNFNKWYSTKWTDFRILWMTQIDKQNGFIWGFSTGEKGVKYNISPGLTLGFIHQRELGKNMSFTIQGTTVIGGWLKEKSCMADYGEIGGVQEVNCRLAASTLEPKETLKYLLNERPKEDSMLMVKFTYLF